MKATVTEQECVESASLWAVMKAHSWDGLEVAGLPLRAPPDGPCKFIPIFHTREQAIAFDDGCDEHVTELTIGKKSDKETE
jgi:hypothetical protein